MHKPEPRTIKQMILHKHEKEDATKVQEKKNVEKILIEKGVIQPEQTQPDSSTQELDAKAEKSAEAELARVAL